jgi:hypothetical protein
MDVVSVCALRVASLLWKPKPGTFTLTVVCKATYRLARGLAELAPEQEVPSEEDNYWNDDPDRSLYAPSDLAPFKPRADVTLVGHAFAPKGAPVRSLVARLKIGDIDKSILALPTQTRAPDGSIHEGQPFMKMPLRYERAAAGQSNPVGVRGDAAPDARGLIPLPNLRPAGASAAGHGNAIPPVGFGPIAPTWPERIRKLPRQAAGWSRDEWRTNPMPEGIDPSYFNAAPTDQQLDALRDDERILLENLHPEHPALVTTLPGVRPRAITERGGAVTAELPMRADTLWIDTDRGVCTLTWRGQLQLDHPGQHGRVVVDMVQSADARRSNPSIDLSGALELRESTGNHPASLEGSASSTTTATATSVELDGPTIVPSDSGKTVAGQSTIRGTKGSRGPTLPFRAPPIGSVPPTSAPPRYPAPPPASPPPASTDTQLISGSEFQRLLTLPFVESGARAETEPLISQGISQDPAAQPVPAPPSSVAAPGAPPAPPKPPPFVTAPPGSTSPEGPIDTSPAAPSVWAMPGARRTELASPQSPSPPETALKPTQATSPVQGPLMGGLVAVTSSASSGSTPGARPKLGSLAALKDGMPMGAAAASNAAAEGAARGEAAARAGGEQRASVAIELLWYEPIALSVIRKLPEWKDLVAGLKPKPRDADFEAGTASPKRQEARERREIMGVLTQAAPASDGEIDAALREAVDDDGVFVAPLILVTGELALPFDELETLKATLAAVAPFTTSDKKLKETTDVMSELLKSPWLEGASGVVEELTAQVREAFAEGHRTLPPQYLETHAERMLLERRHYQKRIVLGQPSIRGLLTPSGGSHPIPLYLPASLGPGLPMYPRFPARIIAEVRSQVDQYESHPIALRAVALGRALPALARR